MITIKGIIRPNGYPQHYHADVHFANPREFHVDDEAQRDIVDKPGQPLILSPAAYAEIKLKFGGPLVCEPIDGFNGEPAARGLSEAQARIADLETNLTAARDALIREGVRADKLAAEVARLDESNKVLDRANRDKLASIEAYEAGQREMALDAGKMEKRIADLEQQLAAAKTDKPSKPAK